MVYEPFGYAYDESDEKNCAQNSILFPLKYKSFSCSIVFLAWLDVQEKWNKTVDTKYFPPSNIPDNLKDKYLLNGLSGFRSRYINELPVMLLQNSLTWTDTLINKYMKWLRKKNSKYWTWLPYGYESGMIAFLNSFMPIAGVRGQREDT